MEIKFRVILVLISNYVIFSCWGLGSEGEAAMLLAARGDTKAALQLVLQADLPSRAARLLKEFPSLLNDRDYYTSVLQALLRVTKKHYIFYKQGYTLVSL